MSITEKLTASKNALASLLDYANAKTEKNDPDIGEAIKTLVDGYGGGAVEIVRIESAPSSGDISRTTFLSDNAIKFKYRNSIAFLEFVGDSPPSIGNYTLNHFKWLHTSQTIVGGTDQYVSGRKSPNEVRYNAVTENTVSNYTIATDGTFTYAGGGSQSGGLGTIGIWLEIPINPITFELDTTLF